MTLQVGQHVTDGPWSPTKVSWVITAINRASADIVYATIRSGQAGVSKVVPIERLEAWAPKSKEKKK